MPIKYMESSLVEKERAMRLLRNSKLMIYDEYNSMLRMIDQHRDEIKQSSLQKKKRDKDNDMRPFLYDTGDTYETPFFSVLIKMLAEINSTRNANKQVEDLQRVYQWYLINKKHLCKEKPTFGDVEDHGMDAKMLNARPSSSTNPGRRVGILRHDNMYNETGRISRPQTSYAMSRNVVTESLEDERLLEVKSFEGVTAPELSDDLTALKLASTAQSPELVTRPDTAPPYVKTEQQSPKEQLTKSITKQNGKVPNNKGDELTYQAPAISNVSVHFNDGSISKTKKSLHIHLPKGEKQGSDENEASTKSLDRRQVPDLEMSARLKHHAVANGMSEIRSEADEDRVVLDPEKFFLEAEMSSNRSVEGGADGICPEEKPKPNSPINGKSSDNSAEVKEEKVKNVTGESPREEERKEITMSAKTEFISSYSKFQRVQDQKHQTTSADGNSHRGKDAANKSVYQTLLENSRSLGNLQRKKQPNSGVAASALLELATPIGQQLHEQKGPNHISQEFCKEFEYMSGGGSAQSYPHERPSPRLYLRSPLGMKADQSLRKAEITLKPEDNSRQYQVHFPKQSPSSPSVKHYKVSGSVEPNTQRYQYTDDGFGHRTYIKRLSRPCKLQESGLKANQSKRRQQTSNTVLQDAKTPYMNTKSLTSLMIVRHLGRTERRSSDRMLGKSNAMPVWVEGRDSFSSLPDELRYVKMTKSYDHDTGAPMDRSHYHVQKLSMDFPNALHISKDREYFFNERDAYTKNLGQHGKTYRNDLESLDQQSHESSANAALIDQYNGGFFPLRAQGFAVRSENNKGKQPELHVEDTSDPANSIANEQSTHEGSSFAAKFISAANRPNSPIGRSRSPTDRPSSSRSNRSALSGYSKASGYSSRRPRSGRSTKSAATEKEPIFNVKDFSHYCFSDDPLLQTDFQQQQQVNAAVNIQRIFRGYMARRYIQGLKIAEIERERKAAVTLQSAMRGFITRKRVMKQNVMNRTPAIDTIDWARKYKEELKKRDNTRLMKATTQKRKLTKAQVEEEERLKSINATTEIYDIFHDKGPTKAQVKAATITIQRYCRGWLVRRHFKKAREKALKRSLDFNGFLKSYQAHLERIMQQHGIEDGRATISFNEVLEYIDRRSKYEIEYARIARGKDNVFSYSDIKKFFEACGHYPSRTEVDEAIKLALEDVSDVREHSFTKKQVTEIAFYIYVPKGTQLKNTRKSTWLNPLVDGDEATRMKLTKKINEQTNINKVFAMMTQDRRERAESDVSVISESNRTDKTKTPQQGKSSSKLKKKISKMNSKASTSTKSKGDKMASDKCVKPTKKIKVKSAIIIQKHFRGWLQRHYHAVVKARALRRSSCFKTFLTKYKRHCKEIMQRHDEFDPKIYINFFHVNDYIDRLIKFEVNFQMMVDKDNQHLLYKELPKYYEKCNLHPSQREMEDAAIAICQGDRSSLNGHLFTKHEVVNVSFHIYPPKGTKTIVRKSTWLHPIVNGKECSSVKLSKAERQQTSFSKSLAVLADAREKREQGKVEMIDKYTSKESGKLKLPSNPKPGRSKSDTKFGKPSSHKRK
eukprot:gene7128-7933_t